MEKKKTTTKKALHITANAIKGKKVIHVGAVGQKSRLRRHIPYKAVAPDIIGFDISKKDVLIANEMGYDEIFVADATNMEHMDKIVEEHGRFPYVVMPEVIEHVPNLALLLKGCMRLMTTEGKIYMTTPYVWSYHEKHKPSKAHICWFCKFTIKRLLNSVGLTATTCENYGKTLFVIAERRIKKQKQKRKKN